MAISIPASSHKDYRLNSAERMSLYKDEIDEVQLTFLAHFGKPDNNLPGGGEGKVQT